MFHLSHLYWHFYHDVGLDNALDIALNDGYLDSAIGVLDHLAILF